MVAKVVSLYNFTVCVTHVFMCDKSRRKKKKKKLKPKIEVMKAHRLCFVWSCYELASHFFSRVSWLLHPHYVAVSPIFAFFFLFCSYRLILHKYALYHMRYNMRFLFSPFFDPLLYICYFSVRIASIFFDVNVKK